MQRITINDGHATYTRVTKRVARKLFDQRDKPIYVIAHKMRPSCSFSLGMTITGKNRWESWEFQYGQDKHPTVPDLTPFDAMVNEFCFYNANSHETGYYPAFYVESVMGQDGIKEPKL